MKTSAPSAAPPEVAALLTRYQPRGAFRVHRPLERFLVVIASVDQLLAKRPVARRLTEPRAASALRTRLFRLEALLRLYRPALGAKGEKALAEVKALEDALGALDLSRQLRAAARAHRFPRATLTYLREAEEAARTVAEARLEKAWLPDEDRRHQVPALNRLLKLLSRHEWNAYPQDRAFVQARLAEEISKFENKRFNLQNVEGKDSIHEVRRRARWIPLYFLGLGGLVQHSEAKNPIPQLKKLLKDPEAKSPFIALPDGSREPSPLIVSKSLFIALSKLIRAIGEVKEQGERVEGLAHALVESGQAVNEEEGVRRAQALLGDTRPLHQVSQLATALFEAFRRQGVLPALRRELEAAL